MSKSDPDALVAELGAAIRNYDKQATTAALDALVRALDASEDPIDPVDAHRIMGGLRNTGWFDLVERAGDGFVRTGVDEPAVRRTYAQALLDEGHIAAGREVLMRLVDEIEDDEGERAEVQGLLGRAYKQMYLDAGVPEVTRNQETLKTAARYYYDTYRLDPHRNHWQGINAAALVARANRDHVPISGFPDAAGLATEILDAIRRRDADGRAGKWEYGTAVEACVALGRPDRALEWLGRYLETADPFAAASTRRQLADVWGITSGSEFGALLGVLDSTMLNGRQGMATRLTPHDRASLAAAVDDVDPDNLERVLGTAGVQGLQWYRLGLQRSEAVTLISDEAGRGIGSGFLVRGADLAPSLPDDEVFMLTNAHVISDPPAVAGALYPDQARVTFESLDLADRHSVELLWSSPPGELDASLLRLTPAPPTEADPMPVAKRLPTLEQRVYIIGHPLGGELSFSLQDNQLLDLLEPRIHYRAPTEPGSSGSPVFDATWKVIGLHHAGSMDMPRLHPQEGESLTYPANEGISIIAISHAIAEAAPPT